MSTYCTCGNSSHKHWCGMSNFIPGLLALVLLITCIVAAVNV